MASRGALTPRGWYLAGAAVVMALLAFLVGLEELYAVASASVALLGVAAIWVSRRRPQVAALTQVRARLVAAGGEAMGWLTLTNVGQQRLPLLRVDLPLDAVEDVRGASPTSVAWGGAGFTTSFCLSGLAPGKGTVTSYRLPTGERGVWAVGPVTATLVDPLGLWAKTFCAVTTTWFVVHPRARALAPLPRSAAGTSSGALRSSRPVPHGEELRGVREYEPGDDLRRVHWRSTARWDRLMVRQDEASDDCLVWVDLDLRAGAHSRASLELCLEAAASIVTAALAEASTQVRFTTTQGDALGPTSGELARALFLERLALAGTHEGDAASLAPADRADVAVLISASEATADDLLAQRRQTLRTTLLVVAAGEAPPPGQTPVSRRPLGPGRGVATVVRTGGDLPSAWAAAMRQYR